MYFLQHPNMAKETKLWVGRYEEGATDAIERFTELISFDKALYKHDVKCSRAHASMLAKQVGGGVDVYTDADIDISREEWSSYAATFIFK